MAHDAGHAGVDLELVAGHAGVLGPGEVIGGATSPDLPTGQIAQALPTDRVSYAYWSGSASTAHWLLAHRKAVVGEHHELVAGHVGGLVVLSLGHGDGLGLVAGYTGDSWSHRAVVGAIRR